MTKQRETKSDEMCAACAGMKDSTGIDPDDNLPLCVRHWNWWLVRFMNSEDNPPCSAHLMEQDRFPSTEGTEQ